MAPKRKTVKKEQVVDAPDWESMTVVQLKSEFEERSLDFTGSKAELIQRLQEVSADDKAEEPPATGKNKKVKKEPTPPKSGIQKALEQLKSAGTSGQANLKVFKIDARAVAIGGLGIYKQVHEDCSFMLNQTNIGHNNNKYYVGQLLERLDGNYDVFTKWGRVGEPGQTLILGPTDLDGAFANFEKKFTDKSGNKWENRADFKPKSGKYHLIETEGDAIDDAAEPAAVAVDSFTKIVGSLSAKSALDEITQKMMSLIFDADMFNEAMQKLNLDTKKMPLGKLSKTQIAKGFEALEKIETRLKNPTTSGDAAALMELSNEFYTVIPHDFKRTRPPTIGNLALVQEKFDMLITLGDIEIAQELQRQDAKPEADQHPCDIKYGLLKCKLSLLDSSCKEYKALEKYFDSTKSSGSQMKLRHIWSVDRETDDQRFKVHESLNNRKLLWHGTNLAVVAAILRTGLRIMPHSGGRVGRGIYFASENGKSAGYTRPAKGTGVMFLNEVALGKECEIIQDNGSLVSAPPGFDSVVARGQYEPDPKFDTKLRLGESEVVVPQGLPQLQTKYSTSSFSQSEYLVYRESQVRIQCTLHAGI